MLMYSLDPFRYDDPLSLESSLTEEERMIQTQVRQYCQDKLMPRILQANREGKFHKYEQPFTLIYIN